jgi:serine/threonine protein kinase/formylglycine-generating enzyme required for sulfatase activity
MNDDLPTQRVSADDRATVRAPKKEVVFKRYELVCELGRGGMGKVCLARDRTLDNSEVALKFLKSELASDPQALQDLKREVLNNYSLTHENIIRVRGFETDETAADPSMRYAISMEYVKGTSLKDKKTQRNGIFEVEEIRNWIYQLCNAMQCAHEARDDKGQKRPIVHRDIKPANLMIHENGDLKVCDFGIGCTVAETMSRLTNQANVSGTLPYMSPQQLAGKTPAPTQDIYSIGVTIFELLTGTPPFRGTSEAVADQIRNEVAPSIAQRRKELGCAGKPIPVEWERAVAACLAKDAAVRPPTAEALRQMLEGKKVAVGPPTPWGKWAAVAAVLLLAGGGGAAYWKMNQLSPVVQTLVDSAQITPDEAKLVQSALQEKHGAYEKALAARLVSPDHLLSPKEWQTYSALITPSNAGVAKLRPLLAGGVIHEKDEFNWLSLALAGGKGESEASLAQQLVDGKIKSDEWHGKTLLYNPVPDPSDQTMKKVAPLLNAGTINQGEELWLHDALAGQKGADESALAQSFIEKKAISVEEWRAKTAFNKTNAPVPVPVDPFLEKVKPFMAAGTVTKAEGDWLRASLAGEKNDAEKVLAAHLTDDKSLTPGQWRARTTFNYALKDDVVVDPAQLPTAIDLPLNAATNLRMLRIDPGTFLRGSPKDELGHRQNEPSPEQTAITKPFFIGIYEVTQAQYTAIMPKNPSWWHGNPTWPIDQVDWQVVAGKDGFIAKLNRILGAKYGGVLVADLPTEDEWEYACRAGTQTSFYNDKNISNMDSDSALDVLANYNRVSNGSPRPVGSYQPNAWGLYDMLGNVKEWCQKGFIRGGSWSSRAADTRAAWRNQISADGPPSNQVGFRLVLRYKSPATGN